jgi:L-gulonolactone oxidase
MKQTNNYRFFTWAKNLDCTTACYYQPETEEEIIELVKKNDTIRVVGTGHSWSAICINTTALVNFDHYNKVLQLDKEKQQVTVQPGIKLWQLNDYLAKEGFALANLGSIDEQSLAGVISTATHGSGIQFQVLASQVEELSIIKPNGDKWILHRVRDKEVFNLAIVGLGCLGIISEISLNIVPAYQLHDRTTVEKFDEVIDKLDEYVNGTDHFKLWWFPHIDEVVVYRYTRTNTPRNDWRIRQWLMDEFLSVNVYRLLLALGGINRNWRKFINKVLVNYLIQPLDRIEQAHKVFVVPKPPLHRETEWGFDIAVSKQLLREYKQMINASSHRINFLQEIRFSKADSFALSPCYGRNTIWLGAYNADNHGWNELLNDFELLAKKYNGRPHWGKEFNIDKTYLQAQYPMLGSFNNLRLHVDPTGKFANHYINQIFS